MEEEALIYVAGNPNLFPLEYYDPQSGEYLGAIPAFLERFAQEYGYRLEYYQPGQQDRREDLCDRRQVDIVSGCEAGEQFTHTQGEPVVLLETREDGEPAAYLLHFTQAAPAALQEQLREYAAQYPAGAWTGAILQTAENPPQPAVPLGLWAGVCIALAVAATVLGMLAWQLAKRGRRMRAALLDDPDTGFVTQAALAQAFPQLVNDRNRALCYLVYFHLDLDHIGYLGGWEQATLFLRHGAEALRQQANEGELLARAGGGLVALKQAASPEDAAGWASFVLRQVRAFQFVGGPLRQQDAVAGICPLGEPGYGSLEKALFHARQCAFAAGREGDEVRICATASCQACQERWQLVADFRRGLELGEFQLCLQFFVDARSFRVVGGEALSRWKHPSRGLLSPDRYVPLLEREGGIQALDFYGLEATCAFLQELGEVGEERFFISCNFSRRTFSAPDFARRVAQVVGRHQFPRKLLILEVTESQWIGPKEGEQMLQNILEVRELGVRVVFDDFGMGFSSFHDLQQYPMDGLKLDKQLVDNMWTHQGRVLLDALVKTGHALGLTILAEGVEDPQQLQELQRLGCDVLQGFHFSIPLPAQEAKRLILERETPKP